MKQNPNCIFCKIVLKKELASIVYEDKYIMAFMGIRPINPGQCLIITKEHIEHFIDISDEQSTHIMVIAQKIGRKIFEQFKPEKIGYVVHGYGVPHAHLLIISQKGPYDITSKSFVSIEGGDLKFRWENVQLEDRETLDGIAEKIKI